jgi:hypothetical protein
MSENRTVVMLIFSWFSSYNWLGWLLFSHGDDDGGSKLLWNVGQQVLDYTAQHPRRQSSSFFGCLACSDPEIILKVWIIYIFGRTPWTGDRYIAGFISTQDSTTQRNGDHALSGIRTLNPHFRVAQDRTLLISSAYVGITDSGTLKSTEMGGGL